VSVFKLGDVYWYRFMYKGTLIRKSTRQGNKDAAKAIEANHLTKLAEGDAGILEKPPAPTLAHFLTNNIEPWARKRKKWLWYGSGIRPLLLHKEIAGKKLDGINTEDVLDYATTRDAQGLAVGTINRELRVLRCVLNRAVTLGVIDKAPKVEMHGREVRRERVVGDSEFARYLQCASPLLADVATVLNDTGLRPDECHRLEWSDITFVNGRHGSLFVRYGKTSAARRRLPLTPRVRVLLQARWENAGRPETGWIWKAPTKIGHIDHSTLKKQQRAALQLSGVRPFVLYSLRHSFATRIASGVDAWTLCRIMGWASLSVAMTYVHADDAGVLAAFSRQEFGHTADAVSLPAAEEITRKPHEY
jgi:integrase